MMPLLRALLLHCLPDALSRTAVRGAPGQWLAPEYVLGTQLDVYWSKKDVPSTRKDASGLSGKTHEEGNASYEHLARAGRMNGWLFASTDTGFVLHCSPFVGVESASQRYLTPADEVEVLVHDDACHLQRSANRRSGKSALAARLAHPRIRYVVGRMHSRGRSGQRKHVCAHE